jgi:hypothetical protein
MWRLRWARHGASAKMWPLLGWFSSMLCVGSVAGCVAWGASSQANAIYYEQFQPVKPLTRAQFYTLAASYNNWNTVFYFFGGIEFLCLIIAKLLLLGRLGSNALRSLRDEVPGMGAVRTAWRGGRALPMLYKVFAAAVALCSAVGMAACFAAGAYNSQHARLAYQAAAACDPLGGETDASRLFVPAFDDALSHRYTCLAVQSGSEAVALVLVSCAYLLIVTLSVAIFRQAEKVASGALVTLQPSSASMTAAIAVVDDSMHAAAEQRRRVTLACVIVLISFPCRVAFDLLQAYSAFDVHYNTLCPSPCGECQTNQYVLLSFPQCFFGNNLDMYVVKAWLLYTPEFQSVVFALSSPLPLTLSMWLITAAHTRALALHANMRLAMTGAHSTS